MGSSPHRPERAVGAAGPLPPRGPALLSGDEWAAPLRAGRFEPFFQPQVLLASGALLGFEALARLTLPNGRVLPPARFLPAAERSGIIREIDEVILVAALDRLVAWRAAGLVVPRVSVNASASALRDAAYVDRLRFHLDRRDLEPCDLAIEIVESTLIEDDDDVAVRNVRAIARAGIAVELDDFGSGHAAVSNLLRLELRAIKLDRSIVRGLGGDGRSEKIVRALVTLADELDLRTIAEGVEVEADIATLRGLGCWAVQGYALARPMPGSEVTGWIKDLVGKASRPDLRLSA
jgi:EAL domain-containing protein (putative c-di-GMP-specific phosphodiesterase class I)